MLCWHCALEHKDWSGQSLGADACAASPAHSSASHRLWGLHSYSAAPEQSRQVVHHILLPSHQYRIKGRPVKIRRLEVSCLRSWSPHKQIVWVWGERVPKLAQLAAKIPNCEVRHLLRDPRLAQRVAMYSPPCRQRSCVLKQALIFDILYQHGGLYVDFHILWLGRPMPLHGECCFVIDPQQPRFKKQFCKKQQGAQSKKRFHNKLETLQFKETIRKNTQLLSLSLLALPQSHPLAMKMADVCWGSLAEHSIAVSSRKKRWLAGAHTQLVLTKSVMDSSSLSLAVCPSDLLLPFPHRLQCWPPPAAASHVPPFLGPSDEVVADLATIGDVSCTVNLLPLLCSRATWQAAQTWCSEIRRTVDAESALLRAATPWLEQCRPFMRAVLGTGRGDGLLGATVVAITKHPFLRAWWGHSPHILASLALFQELSRVQLEDKLWQMQVQEARRWLLARLSAEEQLTVLQATKLWLDSSGGMLPKPRGTFAMS
jgi:hypothetical protein